MLHRRSFASLRPTTTASKGPGRERRDVWADVVDAPCIAVRRAAAAPATCARRPAVRRNLARGIRGRCRRLAGDRGGFRGLPCLRYAPTHRRAAVRQVASSPRSESVACRRRHRCQRRVGSRGRPTRSARDEPRGTPGLGRSTKARARGPSGGVAERAGPRTRCCERRRRGGARRLRGAAACRCRGVATAGKKYHSSLIGSVSDAKTFALCFGLIG